MLSGHSASEHLQRPTAVAGGEAIVANMPAPSTVINESRRRFRSRKYYVWYMSMVSESYSYS